MGSAVQFDGPLKTAVPPGGSAARRGWTLTQTLPSATTRDCGLPPISTVDAWTIRSSASTTFPSPPLATQTLPSPPAIAVGVLPTGIVVIGEFVAGSIGLTVPSSAFATQTARFPTAIADGSRP